MDNEKDTNLPDMISALELRIIALENRVEELSSRTESDEDSHSKKKKGGNQ